MRVSIFLLFLGVAVASAKKHFLSDDFINEINAKQNLWTAGRNFDENLSPSYIRGLLGAKKGYKSTLSKKSVEILKDLPENFDSREQWPECKSIKEVRDQSTCGSCWAFGAVEAMSDRICIATEAKQQISLSANDLLACCSDRCGDGCDGGYPEMAWEYWIENGIVSGGGYDSNEGCQSYAFPSCEHHTTGPKPPCGGVKETPKCTRKCDTSSNLTYQNDLNFGKDAYNIDMDQEAIKSELFKNGPVEASFAVYEDFLSYKNGVYQHTSGDLAGYHAVKILGWGVENDVPYWLVANSWNEDWGDKGFFKILRGNDECGIEESITAGVPKLK